MKRMTLSEILVRLRRVEAEVEAGPPDPAPLGEARQIRMQPRCDCGCTRDHKDSSVVEGPSGCVLCNWCSCRCHWPPPEVAAARHAAYRQRMAARKRR